MTDGKDRRKANLKPAAHKFTQEDREKSGKARKQKNATLRKTVEVLKAYLARSTDSVPALHKMAIGAGLKDEDVHAAIVAGCVLNTIKKGDVLSLAALDNILCGDGKDETAEAILVEIRKAADRAGRNK